MITKSNPKASIGGALVPRRWPLTCAKARLGEVVRLAKSEGPQHVTVRGRDAVVVIDAAAFRRMATVRTGQLLIDALQASPHRKINIEPQRAPMPTRRPRC
jgi:prevent-host-death family protein